MSLAHHKTTPEARGDRKGISTACTSSGSSAINAFDGGATLNRVALLTMSKLTLGLKSFKTVSMFKPRVPFRLAVALMPGRFAMPVSTSLR